MVENISHADEDLESYKQLVRNLEEKLAEILERHIQNLKEQNAQRGQQLSELEHKYTFAPGAPQTTDDGEDFPHDLSQLSKESSTSSKKHT
jgi:uncharacterized protein involved in exopolysaccharide biosynthesis